MTRWWINPWKTPSQCNPIQTHMCRFPLIATHPESRCLSKCGKCPFQKSVFRCRSCRERILQHPTPMPKASTRKPPPVACARSWSGLHFNGHSVRAACPRGTRNPHERKRTVKLNHFSRTRQRHTVDLGAYRRKIGCV